MVNDLVYTAFANRRVNELLSFGEINFKHFILVVGMHPEVPQKDVG